jgi:hypothetical protein
MAIVHRNNKFIVLNSQLLCVLAAHLLHRPIPDVLKGAFRRKIVLQKRPRIREQVVIDVLTHLRKADTFSLLSPLTLTMA